jgi:prepilin-type N-terminal cleavage/methylation domain-containing protein
MSIKAHLANGRRTGRGFTLVEVLVSTALFSIATLIVMAVYLYSSKTFAVLANYAQLDQQNRFALDTMTKELRSAQTVVTSSTNSITFYNASGQSVTYLFEPTSLQLVRMCVGSPNEVLLTNCSLLQFSFGERSTSNRTFDQYPPGTGSSIKEIYLSWKAQKTVPGLENTVSEDVQTAKIVIRAAGSGAL